MLPGERRMPTEARSYATARKSEGELAQEGRDFGLPARHNSSTSECWVEGYERANTNLYRGFGITRAGAIV